jgi:arginase family enzyme
MVKVTDLGDLWVERPATGDGLEHHLLRVRAAARAQAAAFAATYDADSLLIGFGGDHTASLGTAVALNQSGLSFDVVWLDAHGDLRAPRSSPSDSPHGMVLALLAGLAGHLPQVERPWRLHLLGVGDLYPGGCYSLEPLGVEVRDVASTLAEWPSLLRALTPNILICLDVNCCRTQAMPGAMNRGPEPFQRVDVLRMVHEISSKHSLLALDVIGLDADHNQQSGTVRLAHDVILTAARAQARRIGATRDGGAVVDPVGSQSRV